MTTMKVIPVHSVVDVITNSSTVIYTEASNNAANIIEELIDDILTVADSPRKASDLFVFTVQRLPREGFASWLSWEASDYEAFPELTEQISAIKDYKERRVLAERLANENRTELMAYFQEHTEIHGSSPQLVVIARNGVNMNFAERILRSLNIEADYDG